MAEKGFLLDELARQESFAIYSLAVYDWLISLSSEVELLLSDGVRPAKFAYVFCRCWPIFTYPYAIWIHATPHSRGSCEILFRWPMFLEATNFLTAALVMGLRVHAFTGQRRFIGGVLAAGIASVTAFQVFVASSRQKLANFGVGCLPQDTGHERLLAGFFLAPMGFDTLALVIMIVHALRMSRLSLIRSNYLLRVFLRDGLMYFLLITAMHVLNATLNFSHTQASTGVGVPLSVLLPNILACRMVLSLRSAVHHDDRPAVTTTSYSQETTDFGESLVLTNPSWYTNLDSTGAHEWGRVPQQPPLPLGIVPGRLLARNLPPRGEVVIVDHIGAQDSLAMGDPAPSHWQHFTNPAKQQRQRDLERGDTWQARK